MKNIIAVTSGKGGVGKSTICCHLGREFAKNGKKTVIIETDSGLRGMDIFLNVKNIVYDLGDIFKNKCSLKEALIEVTDEPQLYVIAAPFSFSVDLNYENMVELCYDLKKTFSKIIIDVRAGIEVAYSIRKIVDMFLMVVTLDRVSVRDAAFFSEYVIKNKTKKEQTIRLIINKIKKNSLKNSLFKNLDEIIDETGLQLISAIPFDKNIEFLTQIGKSLKFKSTPQKIFKALANRIEGKQEKLIL